MAVGSKVVASESISRFQCGRLWKIRLPPVPAGGEVVWSLWNTRSLLLLYYNFQYANGKQLIKEMKGATGYDGTTTFNFDISRSDLLGTNDRGHCSKVVASGQKMKMNYQVAAPYGVTRPP